MTPKPEASETPLAPPPAPAGDTDPNEALIARAKAIIASTGRTSIMVQIRKDGAEFPNPVRLANVDALNDLPQHIFAKHGPGDFDYRVRVGGSIASPWLPLSIADEPSNEDEEEDEDLDDEDQDEEDEGLDDEPEERSLSQDEIIEAAAARLEEREADRRAAEERERARERAIQEPLLAKLAELERKLAPQAPAVSPEVTALRQTVEALQATLAAKERAEADKKHDTLRDELTKKIDSITAALSTPKKKKRIDPIDAALSHLTKMAVVDKTLQALKARASDGDGSGLLESSIAVFEEPLKNVMREAAKSLEKTAKTTLRQGQAQNGANGSAAHDDVPPDLIAWLQLVFKQQHKVLDVEFVRSSLAKPALAASLERLASCTNVEQLHKAALDLLGQTVLDAIKKEPPEYSQGIVQLCAALARSIHSVKTTPPPAPEPEEKEKPTS